MRKIEFRKGERMKPYQMNIAFIENRFKPFTAFSILNNCYSCDRYNKFSLGGELQMPLYSCDFLRENKETGRCDNSVGFDPGDAHYKYLVAYEKERMLKNERRY